MTAVGNELRVLSGETADDHRIIRRCLPGHGFDTKFCLPCPDDTGSQLGYDGQRLTSANGTPRRCLRLAPREMSSG